jgi:PAS domain S-box-containing protein
MSFAQTSDAQLTQQLSELGQENERLNAELTRLRQEYGEIQRSESRYRQVFEHAPISMVLIHKDGHITQMNPAAEQMFGLTLEQLNRQAGPIYENPQLVENGMLPYMLRAFAGEAVIEEPTYYDASRNFEGGKFNYGCGHYSPIRDASGEVEEIVEIGADFNEFWLFETCYAKSRKSVKTNRQKLHLEYT